MTVGDSLTLTLERPAAGGRMIARHEGAVVFVAGGIPGEVVEAAVEKIQRGTVWARTQRVLEASPDRVTPPADPLCGGTVLAHVRYERQLVLKREILIDALRRIGRLEPPEEIQVAASRVDGYRMRARLHLVHGRIGFFREGTHAWCDPGPTRQLLPETLEAIAALADALREVAPGAVSDIELAENCQAEQRAVHFDVARGADPSALGRLPALAGVSGISYGVPGSGRAVVVAGTNEITDRLTVTGPGGDVPVALTRRTHAFFQGNRYLLAPLVQAVSARVPSGRVLDLYAGVGLFAVTLAARGDVAVVGVEGDRTSAHDLKDNAARLGAAVEARRQPVEVFLGSARRGAFDTVIVDPPRTGMTKEALRGAIALRAARLVYVSCDVATFARDARTLTDAGYAMSRVGAFDLFPNTAHVETLAVFERR